MKKNPILGIYLFLFSFFPILSAENSLTNIELEGEFLYWTAYQNDFGCATHSSPVFSTTDFLSNQIDKPTYSWRPGYRLSGYYDVFFGEVGARFTSYQGALNERFTTSALDGFYPLFTLWNDKLPSDYTRFSSIYGNIDLWIVDAYAIFNLLSQDILIYPKIGVRNLWLNQSYDVTYDGGTFAAGTDILFRSSKFYGVGPQIGVTGFFQLFGNFFLTGEALGTWYAGTFKDFQSETFLGRTLTDQKLTQTYSRYSIDLQAGIEWVGSFFNDNFYTGLSVGGDWIYLNKGSNKLPFNGSSTFFAGIHAGLKIAF
jgi:hypothetical protein